jgi:hypothetical protein
MTSILGIVASSKLVASGSFESIAKFTPTSGTNVTFSSIPSTYKHLQLRINYKTSGSAGGNVLLYFNGDTTAANYAYHRLGGNGATTSAAGAASVGLAMAFENYTGVGVDTAPTVVITDLIDYASTTKAKTIRSFAGTDANGSGIVELASSLYTPTTAISSIRVNVGIAYAAGTTMSLYGIK